MGNSQLQVFKVHTRTKGKGSLSFLPQGGLQLVFQTLVFVLAQLRAGWDKLGGGRVGGGGVRLCVVAAHLPSPGRVGEARAAEQGQGQGQARARPGSPTQEPPPQLWPEWREGGSEPAPQSRLYLPPPGVGAGKRLYQDLWGSQEKWGRAREAGRDHSRHIPRTDRDSWAWGSPPSGWGLPR